MKASKWTRFCSIWERLRLNKHFVFSKHNLVSLTLNNQLLLQINPILRLKLSYNPKFQTRLSTENKLRIKGRFMPQFYKYLKITAKLYALKKDRLHTSFGVFFPFRFRDR